ncbi:glycosyltransferase family 2 protein [Segatella albensis]|uniref:glycosyltransferase family 2 protein n=1 Tax=Segatella albensis TaxID=77768 RepID=UPI000406B6C8|nr:glycosyltransferase family 2 protein [Segatella albensis]
MSKYKVTVVTVCYNAVDCIEKTILSVINQTYSNIEYIIIDGKSSDGTLEVINKYQGKIDVIISEKDKGIYDAMNKGLRLAKGDFINFMNAGDTFADDMVLEKLFSQDLGNNDVIYGNAIFLKPFGKFQLKPEPLSALEEHMPFCHQSCFISKKMGTMYPFNIKYKILADYNQFKSIYLHGGHFQYFDIDISWYESSCGVSATNWKEMAIERKLINKKSYLLDYYRVTINGFVKSIISKVSPRYYNNLMRKIYSEKPYHKLVD